MVGLWGSDTAVIGWMAFDSFCEHEVADVGYGKDRETIPITGFSWQELDERLGESPGEDTEVSQYSEALVAILAFLVGDRPMHEDSPFGISARVLALAWMLRPALTPGFGGLSDIATHCGQTKQAVSKQLNDFKRSANWKHCRHLKSEDAQKAYRESAHTGWRTRLANLQKRKESAVAQAT